MRNYLIGAEKRLFSLVRNAEWWNPKTRKCLPNGECFRVILPCSTLAIISVFGIITSGPCGGKTQQLADAVERDEDVEHDGRTGIWALGYLRTDKAALCSGNFCINFFFSRKRRWNLEWERMRDLWKDKRPKRRSLGEVNWEDESFRQIVL